MDAVNYAGFSDSVIAEQNDPDFEFFVLHGDLKLSFIF